jgi:hypothetical protein
VYFEVADRFGMARKIITDFVGPDRVATISCLAHGYEVELPIQCVPDIVRLLVSQDIAVYQAVRYAKTGRIWA